VNKRNLSDSRDQSFEITVSSVRHLEIAVYDRSLVGKHDLIGSASVKLDPRPWLNSPTRDIQIPLQPRGVVHLRIHMDDPTKDNDVRTNMASATRLLERIENDMVGEVVEKMMEFLRDQLGPRVLSDMTRVKDKKKGKVYIGDAELEGSLGGVFEYLNMNVSCGLSKLMSSSGSSPPASPRRPGSKPSLTFGIGSSNISSHFSSLRFRIGHPPHRQPQRTRLISCSNGCSS
jgi:hypothetical protein